MTIQDVLNTTLRNSHYKVWNMAAAEPTIRCNCGFWLAKVMHDRVAYYNRRGPQSLPLADPHFFDKLLKLLTELHDREKREYNAFKKKTKSG